MTNNIPKEAIEFLISSPNFMSLILDQQKKIIYASKPLLTLLGADPQSAESDLKIETLFPDPQFQMKLARLFNAGSGEDLYEFNIGHQIIESRLSLHPIEGNNHIIISLRNLGKSLDEETLARNLVQSSPIAMLMVDENGHIILANEILASTFGYTIQELQGAPIEILVPQELRSKHIDLRMSYTKGDPKPRQMGAQREIWGQHKDGHKIALEVALNPVEMGKKRYVMATALDITERQKQDELSKSMIEGSPMAMLMINKEGKIISVNKRMVTLFGYERKELIGALVEKLLPENIQEKHVFLRNTYMESNPEPRQMGAGRDLFGLKKNGELLPIEIGLNPITVNGELHVIAALVDITERKQQQENLKLLVTNLERSNKELEEFAYVASHDLQEPLRKVESFGDLLKAEAKDVLNEETMSYVEYMRDASTRMRSLINDLLAFSRLSTREKDFTDVDLDEVMQTVLSDISAQIKETNAQIHLDLLGHIEGDQTQLYQLFKNIIGNAIKYRKESQAPIISIKAHREHNRIQIEVEDNGIGFEMQYAEKIFVIFQRLHAKTEYSGTGIGLAMCRKIVRRHNGVISAQSAVGKGSTFLIDLPIKQKKLQVNPETEETTQANNPPPKESGGGCPFMNH